MNRRASGTVPVIATEFASRRRRQKTGAVRFLPVMVGRVPGAPVGARARHQSSPKNRAMPAVASTAAWATKRTGSALGTSTG